MSHSVYKNYGVMVPAALFTWSLTLTGEQLRLKIKRVK
jgi:hypothetical protein